MTFSRNPKSFIHGQAFALPSPPKVGAGCLNWARPDLCGGRGATCVPPATQGLGLISPSGWASNGPLTWKPLTYFDANEPTDSRWHREKDGLSRISGISDRHLLPLF